MESDWVQARELQAKPLRPAHSDVEALDRGTSATLHQVVKRSNGADPGAIRADGEPDIAVIGAQQHVRIGVAVMTVAMRDDADKGLVAVTVAVHPAKGLFIQRRIGACMTYHLDAADCLNPCGGHPNRKAG